VPKFVPQQQKATATTTSMTFLGAKGGTAIKLMT
jgi:hypothetical protein